MRSMTRTKPATKITRFTYGDTTKMCADSYMDIDLERNQKKSLVRLAKSKFGEGGGEGGQENVPIITNHSGLLTRSESG